MLLKSSTAFLLFFIILSTFQSTPESQKVIVQVSYLKHPVSKAEGQSLTLKCTTSYDKEYCGNISVFWCLWVSEMQCQKLTDPHRHLNQIKETQIGEETRFREQDVFVTFTHLTHNDTGFYQCKAVCQHTGASAMGHFINVTVTDDTNQGQKILNRSGRRLVDTFLLTVGVLVLLWIPKI